MKLGDGVDKVTRDLRKGVDRADALIKEFMERHRSPFLSEFFDGITSLGSPVIVVLMIVVLWSTGEYLAAETLLLGLLVSGLVVRIGKKLNNRTRPAKHLNAVFSEKSFPSGHSTSAFMSAAILNHFYNRPAAFFSLATTVAISRVYLEDHYFSDVLAGALTGLIVSTTVLI